MTPHSMATTTTTEEELFECEVLWPEARRHDHAPASGFSSSPVAPSGAAPAALGVSSDHRPCSASSRPVDIPGAACLPWPRGGRGDEDDEEGDGAMVPPHVMVSRRRSEGEGEAAVAFSLRSGTGRARRDLSHLRNSVLRMTGFIEG